MAGFLDSLLCVLYLTKLKTNIGDFGTQSG